MRHRRRSIATIGLGLAVVIATTTLATLALIPGAAPRDLGEVVQPVDAPVSVMSFLDDRDVELVPSVSPTVVLVAGEPGVLTTYACAVGATIRSGSSPFALDGQPRLALHTSTPLWRDLSPGASGPDVGGVQRELLRLGLPAGEPDRFDARSAASLRALAARAGVTLPVTGDGARRAIVWLPGTDVVVDRCNAYLGKQVVAGDPLFSLRSTLDAARVKILPDDLVPGAREVVLGSLRLDLEATGGRLTAAATTMLAGSDVPGAWLASGGAVPLAGRLVLKRPMRVWSVPPSALVVDGPRSCLFGAHRRIDVTVVASRFGQSLVTAATPPPTRVEVGSGRHRC